MIAVTGRLRAALTLVASAIVLATMFASPAYAASNFTLISMDATLAKVSGATLTPLEVSGGLLDYSTHYTMGNAKVTASMQGNVNGDVLEGTLKVETRIIDNYGSEFYKIEEMAFTSTSLSDGDRIAEIIFGEGTEKTNVSGSEVVREFNSGQRISYKIVVAGAAAEEEVLEDSGIRFSDLAGEVEVLVPSGYDDSGEPIYDDEAWDWAKFDMPLPWGTKVKLGERSAFLLSWPDMSSFQFRTSDNEDAVFILPLRPEKDDQIRLLAGNLWINVKKIVMDGSMDIEMGQAVAGIKGTTLILKEDGATSTLQVIEGTVSLKSKVDGTEILVSAGEMVSATTASLGAKQTFDVKTYTAAFSEASTQGQTEAGGFQQAPLLILAGFMVVALGVAAFLLLRKRPGAWKQ